MDEYASDKEQVAQVRQWWKDNGKAVTLGLIIGLGGLFGYRYWTDMRLARSTSASINYEHLLLVSAAGLSDEALASAKALIEGDADHTYAKLAGLVLARLAVEADQLPEARGHLQWVVDTTPPGEIRDIARARLAQLLLDQNDVEGARSLIEQITYDPESQRFAELRGDVSAARGQVDEARAMYSDALQRVEELGLDPEILRLKLDNLPAQGG